MSTPGHLDWLEDIGLTALLRVVLQECARDPLQLLGGGRGRSALVRIGRGAPDALRFEDLLLEAYESTNDLLLAHVTREVGSRTDAEDIVQTAFMRVYAAKPDITDVDKLRGYIWTAAKNLTRDAWRRSAADRDNLDPDGDNRIALLADRAGLALDDEVVLRQTLLSALDTLPRREREAVVLRAYEGHTYAETARIMGVETGTAKAYVHAALQRVRAVVDVA
jgi:RNA polymerase sigma-70 factor (ECF subfamily)